MPMGRWFSTLTLEQRLAAAALALGAVAIVARPVPGGVVTVDARELAAIVHNEVDHVTPLDLADWIVQGRADYRLVDLRDERAFAEYHIPGALHVPMTQLLDASLARNEKVVLYSDGGIHSAQAWFLLRAHGFKGAYILRDGLDGWKEQVLFPVLDADPTPFQATRNERLTHLAARFGGQARTTDGAAPPASLPQVSLPTVDMPAAAPTAAPSRKRKEGC